MVLTNREMQIPWHGSEAQKVPWFLRARLRGRLLVLNLHDSTMILGNASIRRARSPSASSIVGCFGVGGSGISTFLFPLLLFDDVLKFH
jgi:hypothetical protein